MSIKQSSIKTVLEDLKASFKLASRNIVPFFLGMIGVFIVTVILFGLVLACGFFSFIAFGGGFEATINSLATLGQLLASDSRTTILTFVILMGVAFLCPFFVAIGALFGMGREIAESDGTTAEGVFTWYRRKFFSFAGAGVVLFVTTICPILVMGILVEQFAVVNPVLQSIMASSFFIWIVITTGMLSMMLPAIVDGLSVPQAVRVSLKLSWTYFDRVFSTWLAYAGIILLLIVPLPLQAMNWVESGAAPFIGIYGIVAGLVLLLLVFPALTIGLNRVYMILSSEEVTEEVTEDDEVEDIDVSLIGGV